MDFGLLKKYTRDLNVLFVEDDKDFRKEFQELLLDIFPNVDSAKDGDEGLKKYLNYFNTKQKTYDLVISDIKMPNIDGVELVREIYNINSQQTVVVLSARSEFTYLYPLINLGIEHFFTKPLDYNIFLEDILRICSKIYHNLNQENSDLITIDKDTIWNKEKKELLLNNEVVELTKKEILLMSKLLEYCGRIYTADKLINTLWFDDFDTNADIKNLKNVISRLRKKVPSIKINNIYGMGYKIEFELLD